jgi:hypothetical protein
MALPPRAPLLPPRARQRLLCFFFKQGHAHRVVAATRCTASAAAEALPLPAAACAAAATHPSQVSGTTHRVLQGSLALLIGVSCFCACIGSPCLRHCMHGASIGAAGHAGAVARQHPPASDAGPRRRARRFVRLLSHTHTHHCRSATARGRDTGWDAADGTIGLWVGGCVCVIVYRLWGGGGAGMASSCGSSATCRPWTRAARTPVVTLVQRPQQRRWHPTRPPRRSWRRSPPPAPGLRVRVEILGSQKCGIVAKSQSVLIVTNPIIFARTRSYSNRCQSERLEQMLRNRSRY